MNDRLTRRSDERVSLLVTDDDHRMRRLLRLNLEQAGYRVTTAEDGSTAIDLVELDPPELILLDIMMPGIDGFTCLERLREFSNVPVILLTAKGEERDKVRGLDLGADDYLTKPFGPAEMLARVRAVLRRRHPSEEASPELVVGDLTINLLRRRVILHGHEIRLTPTEYKLLYELATNPGRVMLHSDLLSRVWGSEYRDEIDYLWTYVRYLRNKIEPDPGHPRYILSDPGVGYLLSAEWDFFGLVVVCQTACHVIR
jgi:two-component system, OmpR family, KDP operon response regulator KdpE